MSVDKIQGSANGIFFAGALVGCLAASMLADKVGRVRCLQIICGICVIGAVLQAASVRIAMFFVGRFIGGMASGMMNSTVPLYQSEVAPPKTRGRMVGAHGFLLVTGYAMAGWSGYGCYFAKNPHVQWRLLFALQIVAPAALLAASPMLPESPRWLINEAKHERARVILSKLHDTPDGDDTLARKEFLEIERQIELDKTKPTTVRSMLMTPSYRWRLLTGFLLQYVSFDEPRQTLHTDLTRCLCQSTGVLVVNNYQVLLYNNLGLHNSLPLLLYSVYLTWAAFLNWVASMTVDRVGRVRMLTIGIVSSLPTSGGSRAVTRSNSSAARLRSHAFMLHRPGCRVRLDFQQSWSGLRRLLLVRFRHLLRFLCRCCVVDLLRRNIPHTRSSPWICTVGRRLPRHRYSLHTTGGNGVYEYRLEILSRIHQSQLRLRASILVL